MSRENARRYPDKRESLNKILPQYEQLNKRGENTNKNQPWLIKSFIGLFIKTCKLDISDYNDPKNKFISNKTLEIFNLTTCTKDIPREKFIYDIKTFLFDKLTYSFTLQESEGTPKDTIEKVPAPKCARITPEYAFLMGNGIEVYKCFDFTSCEMLLTIFTDAICNKLNIHNASDSELNFIDICLQIIIKIVLWRRTTDNENNAYTYPANILPSKTLRTDMSPRDVLDICSALLNIETRVHAMPSLEGALVFTRSGGADAVAAAPDDGSKVTIALDSGDKIVLLMYINKYPCDVDCSSVYDMFYSGIDQTVYDNPTFDNILHVIRSFPIADNVEKKEEERVPIPEIDNLVHYIAKYMFHMNFIKVAPAYTAEQFAHIYAQYKTLLTTFFNDVLNHVIEWISKNQNILDNKITCLNKISREVNLEESDAGVLITIVFIMKYNIALHLPSSQYTLGIGKLDKEQNRDLIQIIGRT